MNHMEPGQLVLGIAPRDLDRFDERVRLVLLVPFDALLDGGPVSLEHGFHAPVRVIADESVEAEGLRLLRAMRPEEDALHAPSEDDDGSHPHGIRIGSSGK